MRRHLITAVLTIVVAAAVLAGIVALGRQFRGNLKHDPRYQFPMIQIDCSAPPGKDRHEFLREVQYISALPDDLPIFDDGLPDRLTAAFANHAWVERVDRVSVGPGRRIRVELTFRIPVLAVRHGADWRIVDGNGVLLPAEASPAGLPRLNQSVASPPSAGKAWPDPSVEKAAKLAEFLRPVADRIPMRNLQQTMADWQLSLDSGATVLWGRTPGEEADGEVKAELKRDYLLRQTALHGTIDVRKTGN